MTLPPVTATPLSTRIWTGRALADVLLRQVAEQVVALGRAPRLAIVQVGSNPASTVYIARKLAACAKVGIEGEVVRLREDEGEEMLHTVIHGLAHDPEVTAIIVQTPLPAGWQVQKALDAVPPLKDIDGLCTHSAVLRRRRDASALWPATPLGVLRILESLAVPLAGRRVAVVGRGMVTGAPLREMLPDTGAVVLAIDKDTPHPARLACQADVIITAAGAPGLVTREWVKPGAVIIDIGLTRVSGPDGQELLLGDVARAPVEGVASLITAVPGGVGPLTVASLLTNVVDAARLQKRQAKMQWRLDA